VSSLRLPWYRRALRTLQLLIHTLCGLVLATLVKLDPTTRLDPARLGQWWAKRLLSILRIRLTQHGKPAAGGHVIVANHVSWLDIFVLLAAEPTRFVSKSEVRNWPVAGWLAGALGTFYIRRGKGAAAPLVERLVPYLQQGGVVVIFPEGTTSDGRQVLPFHARLFAAAVESGVAVQPAALRYGATADGQHPAPFVGDDDLLSHLRHLIGVPTLGVELNYCLPLTSTTPFTREALAQGAQQAVEQALNLASTERKSRRPQRPPDAAEQSDALKALLS
jgi:lyso-ornithine lipid O-acyltransferase